MTHADRDRSELHAYLAADKADYPRTWKGDGYARAEAAEAKVAELTEKARAAMATLLARNAELDAKVAELEADYAREAEAFARHRDDWIEKAEGLVRDLARAEDAAEAAERALADERAKMARVEALLAKWDEQKHAMRHVLRAALTSPTVQELDIAAQAALENWPVPTVVKGAALDGDA